MCSPRVFKGCLQPFSTGLQCWKSRIRSASRRRHYQSLDLQEQCWLLWKITEFQSISSNQKKSKEITLHVCSLVVKLYWLQVKAAINWNRITFCSCIFDHPYGSTFILTQNFRTSNLRNKNKTNPRYNPQVAVADGQNTRPELVILSTRAVPWCHIQIPATYTHLADFFLEIPRCWELAANLQRQRWKCNSQMVWSLSGPIVFSRILDLIKSSIFSVKSFKKDCILEWHLQFWKTYGIPLLAELILPIHPLPAVQTL